MFIAILHNRDHTALEDDPGREARADVVKVAHALHQSLSGMNRSVELIPVDQDLFTLHEACSRKKPDIVLNLCESLAGDSRGEMVVPAVLEMLRVPYTGSSSLSLALALHKDKAKDVLRARGVPTPDFALVEHVEDLVQLDLPFPLIVKPSREDASAGIDFDSVVSDRKQLGRAVTKILRTFQQPALVEAFIDGKEIYVPLLGNAKRRALPLTEIHFGRAFDELPKVLSYSAKWNVDSPECIDSSPRAAVLDEETTQRCIATALAAFEALDCRDYGRVDLRVDVHGQPYVIDINPNCDLHPTAGFANAAALAGIEYTELALHLIELALERRHGNQAPRRSGPLPTRRIAQPHRDLHTRRSSVRARTHRPRTSAQ